MAIIHTEKCPVCNSSKISPFLTCKDHLVSGQNFSVMICDSCHFAFTQDFPEENEIGKYYEAAEYISHTDTQKGIINKLYHLARKISLNSKARLIQKYTGKSKGDILDIGAGTGYFLDKMRTLGWNISGIEKSEQTRLYAKNTFGIESLDSESLFQTEENSKDAVSMWHVLEHVEKLNETLATIHTILKKDGVAFIALPNKDSIDAKAYKENWAAYDVPRHLWHFSEPDFRYLAEKHGFILEAIKPMHFDVFYISMLSEKNKNTPLASLIGLTKGEFYFLRSLGNVRKSSSITYILKKK